jgi:hypothetical protein
MAWQSGLVAARNVEASIAVRTDTNGEQEQAEV